MNKLIVMGNLTREPFIYGEDATMVARYTVAVNRRGKRDENTADYIPCVAYGKSAEFAKKYLHQGTKVLITGRLQSGSYTNKEGEKIYTLDVVVQEQEFAGGKGSSSNSNTLDDTTQNSSSVPDAKRPSASASPEASYDESGFMTTPIDMNNLPFN